MASPPPQDQNPKPTLLPSPFPATTSPRPPTTTSNPPPPTQQPPRPPPPTPFTPFFTLITDPTETTHHHPTVHYIFSSDPDPDNLITTAALQTLSPPSSSSPSNPTHAQTTKHRHILLDLAACGTKILRAQSLSPDWAVTSAEVRAAPTWGEGEGEGGGGMMVRVEGVERGGVRDGGKGKGEGDGGEEEGESLEGLVERFERGLGELRRVVGGA